MENLRYNRIVVATDADVDGIHIRLLVMTFFLQLFPDLLRNGHLYILQTPLFRVRNKKETHYCYNAEEKMQAIRKLGSKPEISRFVKVNEHSLCYILRSIMLHEKSLTESLHFPEKGPCRIG